MFRVSPATVKVKLVCAGTSVKVRLSNQIDYFITQLSLKGSQKGRAGKGFGERDALILFEACLSGQLGFVGRRPHEHERESLICSGNVFIYEENKSGIKRWTDGLTWSPSRALGNFQESFESRSRRHHHPVYPPPGHQPGARTHLRSVVSSHNHKCPRYRL
jgi:hypothetical protein